MNYFVTGITGNVVPVIIEELMAKEPDPRFYFAIRPGSKGEDIQSRFDRLVRRMDMDRASREKLAERSRLVEIDVNKYRLGIDPDMYQELIENTEKILHGAADVRFDQPYEKIRIPNVVFTEKIYALFDAIKQHRRTAGLTDPTLYYISTGYAYGIYKKPIPEEFPEFNPAKPDNTYAQTKAEAKQFILDKIKELNDRIVIFEPTIIGGSAKTGRTRSYTLHYLVIMLGYLGKLPFLTTPKNTLDIVPVDWVAAVISDIMAKDEFHQGALRLASGEDAVTIRYLHDKAYDYYTQNDPVPGHVIPKIHFVPRWAFLSLVLLQKSAYRSLHFVTRKERFRKLVKGISLLEGYFPYITGHKKFKNAKGLELIEKYTDCSKAPAIQDILDENGNIVKKGYYEKVMADTLETGWGGLVDFERLERKTAAYKSPQAAYSASRK